MTTSPGTSPYRPDLSAFAEAAAHIGWRLCRDAVWWDGACNWLAHDLQVDATGATYHPYGPLAGHLYAGTAGIAWFLSDLAKATGEAIFLETAHGALRAAHRQPTTMPASVYSGGAGIAFVGAELGGEFREDGLKFLGALGDALPEAANDLMAGLAGLIPVLLRLGEVETARRAGELLLERATWANGEASWPMDPSGNYGGFPNLLGLSHGTAGFAWALTELFAKVPDPRFAEAASAAIRYESRWYNAAEENWPDLRTGNPPVCAYAWCHGAPGIALGRARMAVLTGSPEYRAHAHAGLRTTAKALAATPASIDNFSLCHGIAGDGLVMLLAAEILGEPMWAEPAYYAAHAALARVEVDRLPWSGGMQKGYHPSLMMGAAGTGAFFLRLAGLSSGVSPLLIGPGADAG